MLSRFKILFIFFIGLFLLSTTFFSSKISSKFVEFSLRNYCKECLLTILKEESITYQDNLIIFENPILVGKKNPDDVHLSAEQLIFYYEPNFLKREIKLYITLLNPKIDLELIAPLISELLEKKKYINHFFKINTQVQIKNGIFKYVNSDGLKEIYFSSDHDFIQENELNLDLKLECSDNEKNCMKLHLCQKTEAQMAINFIFKDLCCRTMSQAFSKVLPGLDQFEINDGFLNGDVQIAFDSDKREETSSNLIAKNFSFIYKPLNICGKFPLTHFHFEEKNKGHLESEGAILSFNPKGFEFLEYNQLMGNCSLDLNFLDNDHFLDFNFTGDAEHIVSFFPEEQKKYFEDSFRQDKLSLQGSLKRLIDAKTAKDFFSCDGRFNIFSSKSQKDETILFGFELERHYLKNKTKMTLQEGFFKAYDLDLEKYLTPFLFMDNKIKLGGFGDFEGTFDENKINVTYNSKDVSLESCHFAMETDSIYGGEQSYDLKTGLSFGKIPVKNGVYFDKNSGLLFTDIQADFETSKKKY